MKRYMMSDIHGFLEAFEAALKKNRPFGEKSADSVGRLHRLWARWPGGAGKSQGIAGKIWFGKSHCPDGKS